MRADRIAHHADLIDQALPADQAARDEVAVAAGIFGEAVDADVGALLERMRPERPEEGIVDRDRRTLASGKAALRAAVTASTSTSWFVGFAGLSDR